MGLKLEYLDGQTPLSVEELDQLLIDTVTTREELDELEQLNIQKAIEWTMSKKFILENILSEEFVRDLHKKMFDEVWKWAGQFRLRDTNLGIEWLQIGTALNQLNENCKTWISTHSFTDEEIAIRYKHEIVRIHCFPNGNGRHSRLMADIIMQHIFQKKIFTWSGNPLTDKGDPRENYLNAVKQADKGNFQPLIEFARS